MSAPAPEHERRQLAAERRKARHYAVQALYQWAISANAIVDIERQFVEDFDFRGTDREYFHDILHGVAAQLGDLEAALEPYLDIALEKLGPVERAVLRLAAWELACRPDVPYRVVLNEAVALAKKFGAVESHKFVNAVLDRVARELRPAESARPR
ncbi:MAG: Transcription antitermination protein NusB [Pseudomonadales bacterium]|nr:Transcription antitermination protein NusB [Pseudomonadales bacterium]